MKKLVIFDFDGTLVDSVGGLASAVNYALTQLGFPTHSIDTIRSFVGNGILSLLQKSLPKNQRSADVLGTIKDIFLEYYDAHNTDFSSEYQGITAMLTSLQERGISLAIASNKYHAATVAMASYFFPDIHFSAVLGQRDGVPIKPDPSIVFDVMEIVGVTQLSDILYVGDSDVDIQTANNAGVDACGVSWGFRSRKELESLPAKWIVDSVQELESVI